ncbi:MAG: tail fiber domain-containing protein [Saprospiraceae bacterium]|nr:tail fiber domain-containing protein [Saprospiraceae bacterium]
MSGLSNPFIQTSDIREKTAIEEIDYGLDDILKLRPVTYKWKDRTYEDPHLGLIAQEVQQIIPEVVVDKDFKKDPYSGEVNVETLDRLGMRSTELIPVLIKAIQEQQVIIDAQTADIAELQRRMNELVSSTATDK